MKKVFIGVLAALMLVAFVACDNGTTVGYGVVSVVATETPSYVLGEAPAVEDFGFVGIDLAGNKVAIDTALISDFERSAAGKVSFKYDEVLPCSADYEEISTGVTYEVDADDAEITEYYATTDEDYQKIDLTGVVVTAKYNGETITLDNAVLKGTLKDWTVGAEGKTVQISYDGEDLTGAAYDVEVVQNLVASVSLYVDPTYKVYVFDNNGVAQARQLKADKVYMNATMVNGETKKLTSGVKYGLSADKITANSLSGLSLPNIAGNQFTLYAEYTGDDCAVGFNKTPKSYVFTLAEDSVIGISVTPGKLTIDTDYSKEKTLSGWTVKTIQADPESTGTTLTINAEESGYTIDPSIFSSDDYEANDRVYVTVTAEGFSERVIAQLED